MALFSKKPSASAKAAADKEDQEETKYEVAKSDAPKAAAVPTIQIPTVLVQPRISEKAAHLAQMNKYVFKVLPTANKVEVKKAVEGAYKVRVIQVNMVTNLGKNRTFSQRAGRTSRFKKAIVTLRKGDKIEGLTDVV